MTVPTDDVNGIPLIPDGTDELDDRQRLDYAQHRERWLTWCLSMGRSPETATGYSQATMDVRHYRMHTFYRWVWDHEDGYTLHATTDHADAYTKELVYEDTSETYKANFQKAIKTCSST